MWVLKREHFSLLYVADYCEEAQKMLRFPVDKGVLAFKAHVLQECEFTVGTDIKNMVNALVIQTIHDKLGIDFDLERGRNILYKNKYLCHTRLDSVVAISTLRKQIAMYITEESNLDDTQKAIHSIVLQMLYNAEHSFKWYRKFLRHWFTKPLEETRKTIFDDGLDEFFMTSLYTWLHNNKLTNYKRYVLKMLEISFYQYIKSVHRGLLRSYMEQIKTCLEI